MNTATRQAIQVLVRDDPSVDIVIVHHADGGNDFFSAKPDVQACERPRIIQVCREIASTLENIPPVRTSCAGGAGGASGCPTT